MIRCEKGFDLLSRYAYWWAARSIQPAIINRIMAPIAARKIYWHAKHCHECGAYLFGEKGGEE